MSNQGYTSALQAIKGTPVHYGQSGVRQCSISKQVYTSALWAIRGTPVHYKQAGLHHCTMVKHVYTSALWAIRGTPGCPVQYLIPMATAALEKIDSGGREIFSVDLTVCML